MCALIRRERQNVNSTNMRDENNRGQKLDSPGWIGVAVYSLGWSGCVFTGVEWLCVHWGGLVV